MINEYERLSNTTPRNKSFKLKEWRFQCKNIFCLIPLLFYTTEIPGQITIYLVNIYT